MDRKSGIENDDIVGEEISTSMAVEIADRVDHIRLHKAAIETKREEAGIVEREKMIESLRVELLELCREFNELTGQNWEDADGYARYVHAGKSHRYQTATVDEVAAAIAALQSEMFKLAIDVPLRYRMDIKEELVFASFDDLQGVAFDKSGVLDALAQERDERIKMAQEFNIRLNALDEMLKRLAAARTTTDTKETVAVK